MAIETRDFFDDRPPRNPVINTMRGDTVTDIAGGTRIRWNFSNSNDIVTDNITTSIPSGRKRKRLEIQFNENVQVRGQTIYFRSVPMNCNIDLWKVCKDGGHFEDPNGSVSGNTIGRNPAKTYTFATADTPVFRYVISYRIFGVSNSGIKLNKDDDFEFGLLRMQDDYAIWLEITTANSDSSSAGFMELQIRRPRTRLLPSETL